IVPEGDLASATDALATDLASKPPQSMRLGKHAFFRMSELNYDAAIDFARSIRGAFLGGEELRQGTSRFLKKKKS
ncbi:MAG TPA: hypothetical protein VF157_03010, partial [Chloroflexota bacterium]